MQAGTSAGIRWGAAVAAILAASPVWADRPVDKGLGFQDPATAIAVQGQHFHNFWLLPLIVAISLFVLGLLLFVAFKFNRKANPVPSKTTHNVAIEVVWTIVPVFILAILVAPSMKLLYAEANVPKPDLVIKATGNQWNWTYEYVDDKIEFLSALMPQDEAKAKNLPWLLEVDNRLVVPAGKVVKMQVTASDVLHSWAMPAFFVKMDAVPGRLNETWFKVDKPGIYYGQCSELCGKDHAYMPIAVQVLPEAEYKAWLAQAKTKFASLDAPVQYVQTQYAMADTAVAAVR